MRNSLKTLKWEEAIVIFGFFRLFLINMESFRVQCFVPQFPKAFKDSWLDKSLGTFYGSLKKYRRPTLCHIEKVISTWMIKDDNKNQNKPFLETQNDTNLSTKLFYSILFQFQNSILFIHYCFEHYWKCHFLLRKVSLTIFNVIWNFLLLYFTHVNCMWPMYKSVKTYIMCIMPSIISAILCIILITLQYYVIAL